MYASVENFSAAKQAAAVLGVDAEKLAHSMCVQTLCIAGDTTDKLLTPDKAHESRDALYRRTYSKMFEWVMERINASMRKWGNDDKDENVAATSEGPSVIGILDIFGFELFGK